MPVPVVEACPATEKSEVTHPRGGLAFWLRHNPEITGFCSVSTTMQVWAARQITVIWPMKHPLLPIALHRNIDTELSDVAMQVAVHWTFLCCFFFFCRHAEFYSPSFPTMER